MNAMILAAGRGERLRPYTDDCPKPLLKVHGKALIEYHLEALADAGIGSVVINLSWLGEKIERFIGNGSRFGLEVTYSREPEALETAGAVVKALPYLDDRFIVVNADIYTDYPLRRLCEVERPAHLVLVDNPDHNVDGDFTIKHGLLGNGTEGRYTFAGIGCYQKTFFSALKPGKQALAPLLREAADNGILTGEIFSGGWIDVGTVERWKAI